MERDLASASWSLEAYFMQEHTQDALQRLHYSSHVSSESYLMTYLMEATGETYVPFMGNISLLDIIFEMRTFEPSAFHAYLHFIKMTCVQIMFHGSTILLKKLFISSNVCATFSLLWPLPQKIKEKKCLIRF